MKYGLTGQVSVNSAGGVVRVMERHAEILGSDHDSAPKYSFINFHVRLCFIYIEQLL